MVNSRKALREAILSRRQQYEPPPRTNGHNITKSKTPLMLLIEQRFGQHIEKLIWEDSISSTAAKLNVSESVVSYWRKKFPLKNYTPGPNNRKVPK